MHKLLDVHPLAIKEARKALRWYAQRSPRAALEFGQLVDSALRDIEENPYRWPEYLHGTRVFKLRKFPYLVVYRELTTRFLVVALAHGKRRPGYWKRRA